MKCLVVMAGLNGAPFVKDQIASLRRQTLRPAGLIFSDDGSQDDTCGQVRAGAGDIAVRFLDGPQQGVAANFFHALHHALDHVPGGMDLVALCDQDDLWRPGKLAQAAAALEKLTHQGKYPDGGDRPALYGSARLDWDMATGRMALFRAKTRHPSFAHALTQNFAGGNTFVLNAAAVRLVRRAVPYLEDVPLHDWIIYQLVTGAGGHVIWDPLPSLYYRQHGKNVIGAGRGARAILDRIIRMIRGEYRSWIDANLAALTRAQHLLTPANRILLEEVRTARQARMGPRLARLLPLAQCRTSFLGFWGFGVAVALGRF